MLHYSNSIEKLNNILAVYTPKLDGIKTIIPLVFRALLVYIGYILLKDRVEINKKRSI